MDGQVTQMWKVFVLSVGLMRILHTTKNTESIGMRKMMSTTRWPMITRLYMECWLWIISLPIRIGLCTFLRLIQVVWRACSTSSAAAIYSLLSLSWIRRMWRIWKTCSATAILLYLYLSWIQAMWRIWAIYSTTAIHSLAYLSWI